MEKVSKKKGKEEKPDVRGKFSGRIGYVLAVAGSAVGLGNIWRFPYLAAKYGGGMFLLVDPDADVRICHDHVGNDTGVDDKEKSGWCFWHFWKKEIFKIRWMDQCSDPNADRSIL